MSQFLKNIFCIKDVMYLGIILALLLAIIAMNVDLKNKTQQQIDQGRRNASISFAKEYNLGIDALEKLEQAQTPTEMKMIAENMSNLAKLEKENAELKARLAPQQSFDTNTPTPAAATNEDRLLDAYLGGDRSEAATKAAAKLLGI